MPKPAIKHEVVDGFGKKIKVRSKLETKIADVLNLTDQFWSYEDTKVDYIVPESSHTYLVDFTLSNGILLEGKGYLSDYRERNKYVLLKQQHPEIDLRFVFDNPNKLCGGMKSTHAEWAEKYNFPYCSIKDVETIKEWVNE